MSKPEIATPSAAATRCMRWVSGSCALRARSITALRSTGNSSIGVSHQLWIARAHEGHERLARAADARVHRARARLDGVGDLGSAQLLELAQDEHLALQLVRGAQELEHDVRALLLHRVGERTAAVVRRRLVVQREQAPPTAPP